MTLHLSRRALAAGLLATIPAPAVALAKPVPIDVGRGDGERLPDHAAFWSRLPLPFTPAQAWGLLSPATQVEVGAACIGQYLAEYIAGDGMAEADQFLDDGIRTAAYTVQSDILNRMYDRLWALFPDLYGPDGDHPPWALAAGMVLPLGAAAPARPPNPVPDPDPIFAAIEAADAARRAHQGIFDDGLDEDDDAQMARLAGLQDADREAFAALAEMIPTTNAGDVALADFYLRQMDDPGERGTEALQHLRDVLAGGVQ